MVRVIIQTLGAWGAALGSFLRLRERTKSEEAGENREKVKQHERANEVRDRMDDVGRPTRDDMADRVRRGEDL